MSMGKGGRNSTSGKLLSLKHFYFVLPYTLSCFISCCSHNGNIGRSQTEVIEFILRRYRPEKLLCFSAKRASVFLGGCSLFMSLAKIDFNINWKKLIFSEGIGERDARTFLSEDVEGSEKREKILTSHLLN